MLTTGAMLNRAGSGGVSAPMIGRRFGLDPSVAFDPDSTPAEKLEQVRELALELESVFVTVLLGQMRKTVGEGTLVGNSAGERTFAPFLDAERAKAIVGNGGFGIADALVAQIGLRYQAVASIGTGPRVPPGGEGIDTEG